MNESATMTDEQGEAADDHVVMESDRHVLRFRLTMMVMVVLLVVVPFGAAKLFDLDARTPVTIAEDTLREEYGLRLIDEAGNAIPTDSGAVTESEFSVEPGSTTKNVPFKLHGELVHCTIAVPSDDPRSITADCAG